MNAREVRDQLSLYLGLDDNTIETQIMPHLETLRSRAELQDYLTGLLGNDTAQASFIGAYSASRFPASSSSAPVSAKPTAVRNQAPPQVPRNQPSPLPPTQRKPQSIARTQSPVPKSAQAPSVNVSTSRGPSQVSAQTASSRSKAPEEASSAEAASKALAKVERLLRYARGLGKQVSCFCQAQQHPISPVTPLCPKCLLVLCDLNIPFTSACPSCSYAPLASETALANYISTLETEKATTIRLEAERVRFESEEQERERRAIQFPTLENQGDYAGTQVSTSAMGYASKAGGRDHYKQVEQAYRDAQAREAADADRGERRVLSLNTKTKKAKIQTTSLAKTKQPAAVPKKQQPKEDKEDTRKPYIDESDDGLAKGKEKSSEAVLKLEWPPSAPSGMRYQARAQQAIDDEMEDEEDNRSMATTV